MPQGAPRVFGLPLGIARRFRIENLLQAALQRDIVHLDRRAASTSTADAIHRTGRQLGIQFPTPLADGLFREARDAPELTVTLVSNHLGLQGGVLSALPFVQAAQEQVHPVVERLDRGGLLCGIRLARGALAGMNVGAAHRAHLRTRGKICASHLPRQSEQNGTLFPDAP